MIQRILGAQFARVASAAFLIGGFSVVSRFLGLARNRVFTAEFGAGQTLDVYYAAFLIPDFIYNLFVLGLLSAVFIPIFSEYFYKDKNEAWHFANVSLNALILLITVFAVGLYIFMPWFLPFLVSGFSDDMKIEAVRVSRLMLLSPVLLGISSIFGSIIQNFRKYVYYSLAPIFYNVGIILGAILFGSFWGAYGLAVGVVFGAFLHFLIQMIGAFSAGFRYKMILDVGHFGLLKMGKLSIARFLSLAASQINFMVLVSIGSLLSVGSIAIFNLANDIQFIPIGVIAISYAVAIFPKLSEAAAKNEKQDFYLEFSSTVRQILFFVLPISVVFVILRNQIVDVLYGIDFLGNNQNKLIAATLGIFSISIFAQSLTPVLNRAYYALQDTKTPFFTNLISILCNVAFSFIFIDLLKSPGGFYNFLVNVLSLGDVSESMIIVLSLPMAFSIGAVLNSILLIYFLKNKNIGLDIKSSLGEAVKILIASLAVLPIAYSVLYFTAPYIKLDSYLDILTQVLLVLIPAVIVYMTTLFLLKSNELIFFKEMAMSIIRTPIKKSKEELPSNIEEEMTSSKEQ